MSSLSALLAALTVLVYPRGRAEGALRARREATLAGNVSEESPTGWGPGWVAAASRLGARGRGLRNGADEWLPVLDQLAASLRAGLPPAEVLALATEGSRGAVRWSLEGVLEAAREGRQCAPAWARAARSAGRVELELLARSWAISEQLGAPLADAVDSAARSARSQRELSSRLATATAGASATATILSLLPLAGVGVALLMGIAPTDLYGSSTALVSLVLGLLLIAVGRVVVNGMVDRVMEQR